MNRTAALKAEAPSRSDMATPPPCQVEEVKTESIMSVYLLPPLLLVGGMISFYSHMADNFQEALKTDPYVDPFKQVSWVAPIAFSILYLSFLYFGKMYMKTREHAFEMKHFIVTYNAYQCVLNLWCVLGVIHEVSTNEIFVGAWGNTPVSGPAGFRISFLVWVHYNNKYVELLDTMFMIARKKKEQLSFLHVWHHILILWSWFLVCKYAPGGDTYFGALANSLIHVFMYGYYLMRLCHLPCPFKKYITQMQLTQFVVCMTHACYVIYHNTIQRWLAGVQVFVMLNMLVLFGQFYMKAYNKKAETKAADELGQQKTVKVE